MLRRHTSLVLLIVIAAVAFGLRIFGVDYGLPGVYNPDETPILNRALTFAKGDPNPHVFVYPTLYFYALFAWEGLYFVVGRALGLFDSLAEFQRAYFVDPSGHFLAGRLLTVLCGTLTVLAVYALGRRLYDRATGLVAAAFMAVSPVAVRDAHYVKLDLPVTFVLLAAHLSLARLVVDPGAAARRRSWLVAGFIAGLAVSTQYYVAFVAFTGLAAALVHGSRTRDWPGTMQLLLWCGLASAVGFLVGTPFILVDLSKAISDIAHVREVDIDRAAGGGPFNALGPYLGILFRDAVGWPVALAAAAGAAWVMVSDWRRGLFLLAFPLTYLAFIANTVPMSRYVNAMLPYMVIAAACAVVRIARAAGARQGIAAGAACVLLAVPGFTESLRWDLFLRQDDTRTEAWDFIHSQIPSGSSILIEPQSVPLRQSAEGLREALRLHRIPEVDTPEKSRQILALDPYPQPAYRLVYLGDGGRDIDKVYISQTAFTGGDLAVLHRYGIQFVVLKQSHQPNPETEGLESALAKEARLVAEFTPYRDESPAEVRRTVPAFTHNTAAIMRPELERPGPIVQIWAVQRGNSDAADGTPVNGKVK